MVNRYKRTINKSELCAQTSSPAIRTQADGYPGIPIIGRQELNEYRKKIVKKNKQAAKNVLDDFEDTIKKLKYVASSLNVCDNPRLQSLGYRRINFQQHRYFMLYRIENDIASGRIAEMCRRSMSL